MILNHSKFFVYLTFTFIFIANAQAEKWKTLYSPRFKIIIAEENLAQGAHIAEQAEKALDQLLMLYSEAPKNKILIVVDHRTNASNGSATHFPYPHIVIYPTLPTMYSSIGEYNEWVHELILHELVHFLTFYPNHGVYRPIQWVFGNLFAPNFVLLPSWFQEGLAVSLESHLTSGGRMRSENYKELYKVLSSELKSGEENLARINERYLPSFPYGQRPYFFGSLVINETTKNKDEKKLDAMIQGFSKAIPPYNIYSSVKKNFGQSFRTSRKSINAYTFKNTDLNQIQRDYIIKGHSPIWLDDSSFITLKPTIDLTEQLVLYQIQDGQIKKRPKKLTTLLGTERIAISNQKDKIIFDQLSPYKKIYNTTDLFTYDLKKRKTKRITYGAKLREGSFSRSGNRAVAVQTTLSNTKLVQVDLKNPKKIVTIYAPKKIETRISSPSYIGNDSKIVFLEKKNGEKSQLKIFDLVAKKTQTIDLPTQFENLYGIETQMGKLILHAKEKNKPRQHYILDSSLKPIQVTFDPIGTRSASLNKNQILVSHISPEDYVTAWYNDYKSQANTPVEDFQIDLSTNLIKKANPTAKFKIDEKGYSFLDYMIPRYWFPFIMPNYGGFSDQYSISISTGSSDPLGENGYSANLRQDSISNRLSGGLSFFHTNKNLVWGFSGGQFESPLTDTLSRTFQAFGISTRYDFGHDRNLGSSITLGVSHTNARLVTPTQEQEIKSFGPQLSYGYNSIRQEPSRIAPSHGVYSNLSISHYLEEKDYFSYNFLEGYFETYYSGFLVPQQTSFKLFSKGLYSDKSLPTVFSPVNLSGYFTASRQQNSFVIRGYPSGIFQAHESAYTLGMEYYFPLLNIFNGPEALPIFFRRLYGSVVADMGSFKGRMFDGIDTFVPHDYDQTYYGTGVELHAEITVGHYIPLKLSLGVYSALKELPGVQPTQVFVNFTTPALP